LAQPSLSVAEIAERLAYDEPTNFARACRRWFGLSPRAYRARIGIGPEGRTSGHNGPGTDDRPTDD
jgi:AraC-like DNA-binding protein